MRPQLPGPAMVAEVDSRRWETVSTERNPRQIDYLAAVDVKRWIRSLIPPHNSSNWPVVPLGRCLNARVRTH